MMNGSFYSKNLGAFPTVHKVTPGLQLDKFVSQFFNDFKVLDSDRCDD